MSLQLSSFHNQFSPIVDPESEYNLPARTSIVSDARVDYFTSKSTYGAGDKIEFRIKSSVRNMRG